MGYEIIKDLAKQKGITLEEIAKHADISYNSLSKIVRNTIKAPKYSTIKHIAEALSMNTDELSYAMGMTNIPPEVLQSTATITSEEQKILDQYRELDSYGKELVQLVILKELSRTTTLSKEVSS